MLSLSLCVDSLVVSTTTAFHSKMSMRRGVLMALIFGVCQGAFPLAGALIGDAARSFIEAVDHWVAFGLLLGVGGKMVVDGCRSKEAEPVRQKVTVGAMALLGVAIVGTANAPKVEVSTQDEQQPCSPLPVVTR